MIYTIGQVAAFLVQSSWGNEPKDVQATAVAVIMAESGGNSTAVGDGGNSIGWMQVYLVAHPWARSLDLKNPKVNLEAGHKIYEEAGDSFSPWSVWWRNARRREGPGQGRYRVYLLAARSAVDNLRKVGSPGFGDILDTTGEALKDPGGALAELDLPGPFDDAVRFLSKAHSWQRIAYVILGGALVVVGLAIVARPAVEQVSSVIPAGAAAKAMA